MLVKERDIQRTILDYLEILENQGKVYCIRNNTGAVKLENGGFMRNAKKGSPDIICNVSGKFIGFEVKQPKKQLSEAQKEAKKAIERSKGIYHRVESLEDVMLIVRGLL